MKRAVVVVACASASALLGACNSCKSDKPQPPPPPPIAAVPETRAPHTVSLLRHTPARVAVSSTVDNPHDFPEHLIDGKRETAWNGRTGDLVGGFIAFSVPSDARVKTIRMSCGFDRDDLFTKNHRIRRLRITRNGALLKEVTLDTSRRGDQAIGIDADGGDFRLEVTETEPGTKKEWRELVVSELDVVGIPGKDVVSPPKTPRVRVGSLDAGAPGGGNPGSGPWPSLAAYCKAWDEHIGPTLKEMAARENYPCDVGVFKQPSCSVGETVAPKNALAPPFLAVKVVTTTDEENERAVLAVETKRGWYLTKIAAGGASLCCLGDCGSYSERIDSIAMSGATLVVEATSESAGPNFLTDDAGAPYTVIWHDISRTSSVCREKDDAIDCSEGHEISRKNWSD